MNLVLLFSGMAATMALAIVAGYGLHREAFLPFILVYSLWYGVYLCLSLRAGDRDWPWLVALGLLQRAALMGAWPALSDDLYRFVWDGRLLAQGINPFAQLPAFYLDRGLPGLDAALFSRLNSPEYFTVYPPVLQGIFWFSCRLFPQSVFGSMVVMKLFLLAFEAGTAWLFVRLLREWGLPERRVLWYVLNPLVVLEVAGNVHFEGAMLFLLLAALWLLARLRTAAAAVSLALSVAAKLLPLLFVPAVVVHLGWRRGLYFGAIFTMVLLLLFVPFFGGEFIGHFGQSLSLYFRQFEFNGSLYFLVKTTAEAIKGGLVPPFSGSLLALLALLLILWVAFRYRPAALQALPALLLASSCIYLWCSATVHPWYVLLPLALGCFTTFRFPVLWCYAVGWTYCHYAQPAAWPLEWVVAVEYGLICFMALAELVFKRKNVVIAP